jgi:hypothetical protein
MTEQNTPRRFINLDDFYVEFNTTPDIKDGFDEFGLSIVKAVVNSEPELTRHLSIL